MPLPDDQGFHEEIQLVLLGTNLRQRLGTEGRGKGEEAVSRRRLAKAGSREPRSLTGTLAKVGPTREPALTFTATCRGLGSLGIPDT